MTREAVVGIDVGGTRIKAALVTPGGVVLAETVTSTPEAVGPQLGEVAAKAAVELIAASGEAVDLLAVGVAVPGLVDEAAGVGVWSANLGWRDLDLRAAVAAHVDVPVAVGHDVRSGLLAEHRLGAARGAETALGVTVGTGIGGAIVANGQLLFGLGGAAGEIGHIIVQPDGVACACGNRSAVSRNDGMSSDTS